MNAKTLSGRAGLAAMTLALTCGIAAAQTEPVKFGALLPLSGPAAIAGKSGVAAIEVALKDINEAGGILGRRIELVQADDQSDPTKGVGEARRLAQIERVRFVFGSFISPVSLAAMPVFTEAKVLQFSSTAAKEATPEYGPYHFSISADGEAQGQNLVDYSLDVAKYKKVAILADNLSNNKAAVDATKVHAAKRGLTITDIQEFEGRTTDMTPQLLSLRRGAPEAVIVVNSFPADTGHIIRNRSEIGWKIPIVLALGTSSQAPGILTVVSADLMTDVVGQNNIGMTYCSSDAVGQGPVPKALARMKGAIPDYDKMLSSAMVLGYDAMMIVRQVFTATKSFDAAPAARWIEDNSTRIDSIASRFSGSKTRHYLVGSTGIAMVDKPHQRREDGLFRRVGC
jgi:branched-chain amino acid transport system substrate-binding protein